MVYRQRGFIVLFRTTKGADICAIDRIATDNWAIARSTVLKRKESYAMTHGAGEYLLTREIGQGWRPLA